MASTTPSTNPEETARQLLTMLTTCGQGDYIGEAISQLAHSLQCAHLATLSNASTETVLAALLHDVGQFLPATQVRQLAGEAARSMAGNVGRVGHESIGARYLAGLGFSDKVCALVGSHVAAKRYLCAVEEGYHASLSEASKASLKLQGGPMGEEEVRVWEESAWGREMAEMRRWDDQAKVVGWDVPGVEAYEGAIVAHLRN